MDKQSTIGLVLIGIILFSFTWFNQDKATKGQKVADSIAMVRANEQIIANEIAKIEAEFVAKTAQNNGIDSSAIKQIGAELYSSKDGEAKTYVVENDLMTISFSNKGAIVEQVVLKDYMTYSDKPLSLFVGGSSRFDLEFFIKHNFNDTKINSYDFYFTTDAPEKSTVTGETSSVSMKLYIDSLSYIEYLYTVRKDNYMIDFDVNFVGMDNILSKQEDMSIYWANVSPQNEKGFDNENNYTSIAYMFSEDKSMDELSISTESKSEALDANLNWVAFKQQFFSSVLIADDTFQNGKVKYNTFKPGFDKIKDFSASLSVPFSSQQSSYNFQYYFGPNKFSTLNSYDIGMQELVPMGGWIIGWLNRWLVIPVFDFLGKYIANYGLIILLLTIFIKLLISPLTYKSYLSSAKMRLLKPEIDEISEKFPNKEDAMKKQQAVMEMYRKAGVSPMGGCLPMLIQMPILFAMFRFFPASIELRDKSFLWADDLSSYDSIFTLPFDIPFYGDHVSLFTILMAISVYFTSKISYDQTAQTAPQMAGMKFMMLYMMPVMLLLWFNNYSSGLSYYYLVSNLITMGQTLAFRYAIDDKKLHAKLKNNAKQPKKKSRWQQKYDDMLKMQQDQQKLKK